VDGDEKNHSVIALGNVFCSALLRWASTTFREARAITAKPNFVCEDEDDVRKDDLTYMPKTLSLLKDEGMTFSKAYVSNPLCCPSRATIMRGQYVHNTGVWDNANGTDGGWQRNKSNYASWMVRQSCYRRRKARHSPAMSCPTKRYNVRTTRGK